MKIYLLFLKFLFVILICNALAGQTIQLNEIVSSNATIIEDEDGDYSDWIEIYNSSEDKIEMEGFGLSDDFDEKYKWIFPSIKINPKSYLMVFASGKNKLDYVASWDAIITESDSWYYHVGKTEPPDDWAESLNPPYGWNVGKSGFGYGDNDDNTNIDETISFYARKSILIEDIERVSKIIFHIDFDDGYVAYLNGKEFSRVNMGLEGSLVTHTTIATDLHEADIKSGGFPDPIIIDMKKFPLNEGMNILAVQVHNRSLSSSDLSCIPFLTVGYNFEKLNIRDPDLKMSLPNSYLHSNFKIESSGEKLIISNPIGTILDSVSTGLIPTDKSRGRIQESKTWSLFDSPTPGSSNITYSYQGFLSDPNISIETGFYNLSQNVNISHQDEEAIIYYTINGTVPDQNSNQYVNQITINKNTVLRATAFKEGWLKSRTVTKSYIFDNDYDLPSFFLTVKPQDFFHPDSGIYVKGPNAENSYPYFGANFWKDIEKPAHIEILDSNGDSYSADAGVKIFGAWSRGHAQKSLSLFARKKYGPSSFNYKFFKDLDYDNYEAFVLRNSGNDWNSTILRDGYVSTLVSDIDIDRLSYRPSQLYINGMYWGIHNLREKTNEHYLSAHHGIDVEDLDIIGINNSAPNNFELIHGSSADYYDLVEYVSNQNLSDQEKFAHISSKIDIEEYINYQIVQIFIDNRDWPGNNVKLWKDNRKNGKWRWIIYDTDFGLGLNSPLIAHELNTLKFALDPNGPFWPNPPWSTLFFRKLIQNNSFKNQFINTFSDYLNTVFTPKNLNTKLDSLKNNIFNFIPSHKQRWGTMQNWNNEINEIKNFNNERSRFVRAHLQQEFNLEESKNLFLTISPPNSGKINIGAIAISDNQWVGSYYPGIPISIKAIPKKGYKFLKWKENSITTNEISHDLANNNKLTAIFEIAEINNNPIVITEINYNSADEFDTGDWVEFYNKTNATIDLAGWKFKDNNNSHIYNFENNVIIEPKSFFIVSKDPLKIKSKFSNLRNIYGPFDFGLGKDDEIRLYNRSDQLVDSIQYQSRHPWPIEADGDGATLELINPLLDNSKYSSWVASKENGTPGYKFSSSENLSITDEILTPKEIHLLQSYPNPFNSTLTIPIEVSSSEPIILLITNILGQEIKRFDLNKLPFGKNKILWKMNAGDGKEISSGIYIIYLKTSSNFQSQKILYLK